MATRREGGKRGRGAKNKRRPYHKERRPDADFVVEEFREHLGAHEAEHEGHGRLEVRQVGDGVAHQSVNASHRADREHLAWREKHKFPKEINQRRSHERGKRKCKIERRRKKRTVVGKNKCNSEAKGLLQKSKGEMLKGGMRERQPSRRCT